MLTFRLLLNLSTTTAYTGTLTCELGALLNVHVIITNLN